MSRTSSIPVRLIDPRGHRFGAAFSVVLLAVAGVLDLPIVVAFVAVALGVSALFGTRWSILGRPWPIIRRRLNLGPPANPEPEFGPRFAQALGTIGLGLGFLLLVAGVRPLGWVPVIGVAALQTLLAVTGYCLGCKLYVLHWWVPDAFDRIIGRAAVEAD
jgi:Domain of unknown function (DUF4395)